MKRLLLFPFSLLYGIAIRFRNFLFNIKLLSAKEFDIPLIGVGNLSAGGNGKTPTTEYLIRLLKDDYKIAILSRGYGRKTKGFIVANQQSTYQEIGDEPTQIKQKFPEIMVAVCERRVKGVNKILKQNPDTNLIILDDCFQHRYVKPGLMLLLTDYHHPYTQDWLIPAGKLREHQKNYKRADSIIVTKSPKVLSPYTIQNTLSEIKPLDTQQLFFNHIQYTGFVCFHTGEKTKLQKKFTNIVLFSGVANPYHLEEYLKDRCSFLDSIHFRDHHQYKNKDFQKIIEHYERIISRNKIIVTTEKDVMRLKSLDLHDIFKGLPLYYLEMEFEFHQIRDNNFDDYIRSYVRKSSANN